MAKEVAIRLILHGIDGMCDDIRKWMSSIRVRDNFISVCDTSALENTAKRDRYLVNWPTKNYRHDEKHEYLKMIYMYFEERSLFFNVHDIHELYINGKGG